MKFVIKSLLFVNLILQMTSSLRKCFDHEQNLMLTIVLLAFSLIGIIGLTIGNRFILIIFAACMTLILIASITIYAIARSEVDANQPKVPYFTTIQEHNAPDKRANTETSRLKSLVNKLLNRNEKETNKNKNKWRKSRNRTSTVNPNLSQRAMSKKLLINSSIPVLSPTVLDDYSDEPQSIVHLQIIPAELPVARSSSSSSQDITTNTKPRNQDIAELKTSIDLDGGNQINAQDTEKDQNREPDESNRVQSDQWIVYERHLYERYLNIVSQSIDLVFHIILASWMALLLDEDADQCFGTKSTSHRSSQPVHHSKDPPQYNYNGVRYSIRPDTNDSPARVTVR